MSSTAFRTALITGGSRGIGYHLAQLFARDKYGLILVSRKRADLEKVAEELKSKSQCPQITIIDKDLSKLGAAEELYDEIKNKHQLNIDFLVNNAGSGIRGKIWETDLQDDLKTIQLNIIALVTLTKLILPDMIKRNSGRILMLGSSASSQPSPLLANYAATKAFIANYTDALINELKETRVRATLLVPGPTDTEFFQRAGANNTIVQTINLFDDPQDVAQRGYDALIKGEHRAYGSNKVKLVVGIGQILPNEIVTKVTRLFMEEKK